MDFRRERRDDANNGSDSIRRAIDALIEGQPVPVAVQAALTDAERAEVAAIARTAHLTRLVLHSDIPSPAAEAAALNRAQTALTTRRAGSAAPTVEPANGNGWQWLNAVRDRLRDSGEDR